MAILESEVKVWLDMEEGSGTTTTNESTVSSTNGALFGTTSWVTGGPTNIANGIDLDGTSGRIDVAENFDFADGNGCLAVWVNADTTAGFQFIADLGNSGGEATLFLWDSQTNRLVSRTSYDNVDRDIVSSTLFSINTTYLVLYNFAAGDMELFLNNISVGTNTNGTTIDTTTENFRIGARSSSTGSFFLDGTVYQALLFDRPLDATERAAIYNSGAGTTYSGYFGASATTPTVTTQAASSITDTTATLNGNVTDDGGATITERGFYYSTSPTVTTGDTKVTTAGTTGAYTNALTGLTASTTYYYRAFATNSEGTTLDSSDTSFTTSAASTAPSAFTSGQWSIADLATTGDARITITALPSDGGSAITDLEVKVGAAAYASLAGTTTGTYDVAGFTDGVSTNVLIRAVNSVGNGADSDTKSVTTTAPAAYSPADTDLMYVLDVSDTTDSAAGEFKPVSLADLKTYFNT
jgi:hypothetical protein